MKRLRESALFARLFATYLGTAILALGLLGASFLLLVDRERNQIRQRDAYYLAQLAKQVETPPVQEGDPGPAYLVRGGVGRVVIMKPDMLKAFRSEEEPPAILLLGESIRRTALEQPTFTPKDLEPVPEVVSREVAIALRALSPQKMNRIHSLGLEATVCPPQTKGTGVHCAVIVPLEPQTPVPMFAVALLTAGPLDEVYDLTLQWLGLLGGLLLLLAVAIAWRMAAVITDPLHAISRVAERVAAGDLSVRVAGAPPGEMGRVVTVLNQALDRLANAREEQLETDRKRRELVASVSHEFRAPLASLRGYLELMQDKVIPPSDQAKYLSVMLSDTFRLNRLLEDLLEWSRIQTQQVALQPMPTDPLDACHRVVEQLHWEADHNGVEIALDLPEAAPPVLTDPDRLDQVLVNLLENALRYAGRGGWVRVSVSRTGDGQAVRFAVLDSGPGIPPSEQDRVWERFYKVDKARTPGAAGSGLGLAIVKQLVEAMGGQVGLQSAAGRGSTFWFTLPLAPQSE